MTTSIATIEPELATPFPNDPPIWTCPITGLKVPKGIRENLEWRARLLRDAEDDVGFQEDLLAACRDSLLFWTNAFAFTFKIRGIDDEGYVTNLAAEQTHAPYITWTIQDKHLGAIEDAIEGGHDLLTDKSREMGASWNHILVFEHQFLFKADRMFLELSRTEDYVDKADNPKSLFWKHRYIRRWLPKWMLPPIKDVTMHFTNLANNSKIDGESTNANAASGDRRTALLLDEFAKVEQGRKIRWATSDVSACRLVNSTQAGAGTEYSKWRKSGQIKVFVLPWWEHPEKGVGRHAVMDETTGIWEITAPWLDKERERRSPQEVDQEILMKDIDSGAQFFSVQPIEQHRALFVKPPTYSRGFDFAKGISQDEMPGIISRSQYHRVQMTSSGKWKFWLASRNRPDQTKNYIFGVDISTGQGASNSVVSVLCAETREKIAEFVDATVPPYDFARIVAAAAIWIGGARAGKKPLVVWEAQGPGVDFGRVFVKILHYPNFYVDRQIGTTREKQGKKYGWHSTQEKKLEVLGALDRAYAHGGIINHSELALDETLSYVHLKGGGIGPAELAEENDSARKTHGDRTIADAMALLGLEGAPKTKYKSPMPPERSTGYRRKMALARRKHRTVQWGSRIDFSSGQPEFLTKVRNAL